MCHNAFSLMNFNKSSKEFCDTSFAYFKLFNNIPIDIEASLSCASTQKKSISDDETTDSDLTFFYYGADLVFNATAKPPLFFCVRWCGRGRRRSWNFYDCGSDLVSNNVSQKRVGFLPFWGEVPVAGFLFRFGEPKGQVVRAVKNVRPGIFL